MEWNRLKKLSNSKVLVIKSLPVLDFYKNNMHNIGKKIDNYDLFVKLFSLLNEQIRIPRLLFIENDKKKRFQFVCCGHHIF